MINSLIARIFTIFFLILTLMLMLVLVLLQFDSLHQIRPLLDSEKRQSVMLQQYVEAELDTHPASDVTWWCRLFRAIDQWAPPEQHFILATREGKVIGAQRNEMHIIYKFIGQSNHTDYPKKKKYCCMELVGPFSIREGDDHYWLYQIRLNLGVQSNFINLFFNHPFLLLIITLIISIPLLLWLARSLAKPARKLRNAADEVACGNLFLHPELEAGPQEFLSTGISFNQMVSALKRMVTAQNRMLSYIAHELRTPLTRLQLATALMRRRNGKGNELARIETESQLLNSKINELLVIAFNQHKNEWSRAVMTANELWTEALNNAQFEAEQMFKTLEIISPPDNWTLLGNPSSLNSALENIVRNALLYSKKRIAVGFSADHQGITITVDDDGPGVSKNDREHIFRSFYRTDAAQNKNSVGTGLGLAIAETAIIQHHGWVKAEDSLLGGLRLIIWLPLLTQH